MTIGIYAIFNKENGKSYVGKSKNIEQRFAQHKYHLNSDDYNKKACNRHLWNSYKKHGSDSFDFVILQKFDYFDDEILSEAELFWMEFYETTIRENGYNLRKDSSSNMTVHEETRKLMSENVSGSKNPNFGNRWSEESKVEMSEKMKLAHLRGSYTEEWKAKISVASTNTWKNEEKKKDMADKVSIAKTKLKFYQYDKITNELIAVWDSMKKIIDKHPDWHRIAIYSVCNGHKNSYRGYVWKSEIIEGE